MYFGLALCNISGGEKRHHQFTKFQEMIWLEAGWNGGTWLSLDGTLGGTWLSLMKTAEMIQIPRDILPSFPKKKMLGPPRVYFLRMVFAQIAANNSRNNVENDSQVFLLEHRDIFIESLAFRNMFRNTRTATAWLQLFSWFQELLDPIICQLWGSHSPFWSSFEKTPGQIEVELADWNLFSIMPPLNDLTPGSSTGLRAEGKAGWA